MCGIVAYAGEKSSDSVLIVGLKKLEYRGYDSSGVAIIDQNELVIHKHSGRVKVLEDSLVNKKINGTIGIAHTRWATHGEVSDVNSHPHHEKESKIAVVHNGIIENYLALKEKLISKKYIFVSDTDTEIIPNLVDYYYKKENSLSLEKAFHTTIQKIQGKFAIALVSEYEPEKIFFASNGSPVIIAKGQQKEFFLASDIPALIPLGKEAMFLKNKEWGYFTKKNLVLKDWSNKSIQNKFQKITTSETSIGLNGYPHYMLKEIHEQPKIIQEIIKKRISKNYKISFPHISFSDEYLSRIRKIKIQACGTSLNAGMVGKLYLENFAKIYTDVEFSSEMIYRNPIIDGDTLVISISQSSRMRNMSRN